MNPVYSTLGDNLGDDDINGIQAIYGKYNLYCLIKKVAFNILAIKHIHTLGPQALISLRLSSNFQFPCGH